MSHEGRPFAISRFDLAQINSKKEPDIVTIKLYPASQFRHACAISKRNFWPARIGEIHNKYFESRFRIMVEGRWEMNHGKRYCFYTFAEASQFTENFLETVEARRIASMMSNLRDMNS